MDIDVVIIGLNAGKTLRACLDSVKASAYTRGDIHIYFVDSGSSDDSISIAEEFEGTTVLHLETEHPSPGAGRNLGWRSGNSPFVQFIDSDTELHKDWLDKAINVLLAEKEVAAVRGNRTERRPDDSVYNWIADQEWNAEPGDCSDFGGDVLVAREVLDSTGGYDETLVGGEDPEYSQRIRKADNVRRKIRQLDEPMTNHDMAMTKIRQYWKRGYRTGYGFAAVLDRHPDTTDSFWKTEFRRILVRGGVGSILAVIGLLGALLSPLLLAVSITGIALILFPRILRVSYFADSKNLSHSDAKKYAWHCSFVVVPEFYGILRYWIGKFTSRPLRNKRPAGASGVRATAALLLLFPLNSCTVVQPGVHDYSEPDRRSQRDNFNLEKQFQAPGEKKEINYASAEQLKRFSAAVPTDYLIGPGDVLSIMTRGRAEASSERVVVAPDGKISVPRIGLLEVKDKTIEWLTQEIQSSLAMFYSSPEVTVMVTEFKNNKVFVLGRVSNPGLVQLEGTGTLLEALATCGGLPTVATDAFLTRAMIFRGKQSVMWVDLRKLLNEGNVAMNPKLRNNDLIFIPESDDELVFVMGEVANPGAVKLKTELSFMDAVMAVGGPSEAANKKKIYLIRNTGKRGYVQPIDMGLLIGQADFRQDFLLQDGDIIYVSSHPIKKISYAITQLSPALSYLAFAQSLGGAAE